MKKELKFDELMANLKGQDEESKAFFGEAEIVVGIVNELIAARVKKGWSQRELARRTGLKQPAIARFESLDSIPVLDTVAKIAFHLGVKLTIQEANRTNKYICLPKISYVNESNYSIFNNCDSVNFSKENGKENEKCPS